jgi:SAM-dependent methyltransferase
MCHKSCMWFGKTNIKKEEISDRDVIEVGSFDVNGSLRGHVMSLNPKKYIGIDMQPGKNVDIVCNAEDIIDKFGKESFDFVLTTEMMEHVKDWQRVISNLKNVCRIGGTILLTTRSKGFGKHEFPSDYWRYEIDDMKNIFSDFTIDILVKDNRKPGVFLKAKKPENFIENDLSKYKLYEIS